MVSSKWNCNYFISNISVEVSNVNGINSIYNLLIFKNQNPIGQRSYSYENNFKLQKFQDFPFLSKTVPQ